MNPLSASNDAFSIQELRSGKDRQYFPPIESHLIRSKYVRQTFNVQVLRPAQVEGKGRSYPVVYVTDGNAVFDMFKGISRLIQSQRGSPPFIMVAIGYPGDSPCTGNLLRGRDLTFSGCPKYFSVDQVLQQWEGVACPEEDTKDFCGAEDFQHFIGDELIPFIDQRYEIVPGDRTYFGHSMGGGFGLFTLFTQTHLFNNYIISSPTVIYSGDTPDGGHYENHDFLLRHAREFIATSNLRDDIRVYISVGTEEQFDPDIANWQFVSSFYRLVALFKAAAIPRLSLMTEVFSGESHATVWPIAFMHGAQAVFGSWRAAPNGDMNVCY